MLESIADNTLLLVINFGLSAVVNFRSKRLIISRT